MNENLKNKLTLIILGRSGSGKGTQAQFILKKLRRQGVSHLETGKFLRDFLKNHRNSTVNIAKRAMGLGKLFPDWFAIYVLLREILEKGLADRHWVLDGAPRTLWQARLIDDVARWHNRILPFCVYIEVSEKEAAKRLLGRGRGDDKPDSIRNRMQFFRKEVLPLALHYKKEGRLITVNGEQAQEGVRNDIEKALIKHFESRWPA